MYINGRATGLQRHVKVVRIILDTETKARLEWVPIALKSAVFRSSIHRNHVALVHLWPYFFYLGQTLHVASSFSHRLSVSTCHSSCHSVLNLANGQNRWLTNQVKKNSARGMFHVSISELTLACLSVVVHGMNNSTSQFNCKKIDNDNWNNWFILWLSFYNWSNPKFNFVDLVVGLGWRIEDKKLIIDMEVWNER